MVQCNRKKSRTRNRKTWVLTLIPSITGSVNLNYFIYMQNSYKRGMGHTAEAVTMQYYNDQPKLAKKEFCKIGKLCFTSVTAVVTNIKPCASRCSTERPTPGEGMNTENHKIQLLLLWTHEHGVELMLSSGLFC